MHACMLVYACVQRTSTIEPVSKLRDHGNPDTLCMISISHLDFSLMQMSSTVSTRLGGPIVGDFFIYKLVTITFETGHPPPSDSLKTQV